MCYNIIIIKQPGGNNMDNMKCNLCGDILDEKDVFKMPGKHFICKKCAKLVSTLYDMDDDESFEYEEQEFVAPKENKTKTLKPEVIKKKLDEYIIGQSSAKKTLAVAAYNYYKRLKLANSNNAMNIGKSNVLLIGGTGTGKTYLAETLAKIMNVPFVSIDITSFSATGYKGNDISDIVKTLYYKTLDKTATENGIIFIDEIDKISTKSNEDSISSTKVQQSLLKLMEGTEITISDENMMEIGPTINTKNILFICAGAFIGLDKIITKRKNASGGIGFGSIPKETTTQTTLKDVTPDDLIKFGITPELVGRLNNIVSLSALTKEELKMIMTGAKNSVYEQYKNSFKMDGCSLEIEPEALDAIAEECIKRNVGARGLRSIMDKIMTEPSYEIPTTKPKVHKCVITRSSVVDNHKPQYVYKKDKRAIKHE